MPDALSTTIPVWCAVLNRVLLPDHPLSQHLFLPPSLPEMTHAHIMALMPGFVESLHTLKLQLPTCLTKPLRPLWITQDSALPDASEDGSSTIFEDYRPVICCTSSRRIVGSEMDEGGYIQGAGDDTENWAHGLTPPVFWSNVDALLGTAEADLPVLIKELMEKDKASRTAAGSEVYIQLAPKIFVCAIGDALTDGADSSQQDCHIQLLPTTSPKDSWTKSTRLLQVGLGGNKAGSRNLRLALPDICAFARTYNNSDSAKNGGRMVISCESGKDFSVGTALALSCLLFDDAGVLREESAQVDFTKTLIKSRLGGFMTTYPAANPSRATLQSVNSFLMDWRN